MKKSYIPPEVTRREVDGEVIKMLTRQGFVDLFWEKFREKLKEDPDTRREDVFNELNDKYQSAIGCSRYSNYDSFRKRLK